MTTTVIVIVMVALVMVAGVVVWCGLVVGSLRRGEGGVERFLTSLGEVWVAGGGVDWAAGVRWAWR